MKKSKQIKRALTLIIAVVLCFSVAIIPVSAADYYDVGEYEATLDEVNENLDCKVTNGGFETGTLHGWSTIQADTVAQETLWENAFSVTSEEKNNGNYAGKVVKAADDTYYGYQTLVFKPKFDTNYTLTYYAKTTGTAKVGSAFLAQGDESTNWETYEQHWMNSDEYFISAGDWEKREYTFSIPENEDIKILAIRLMVYGEGTAYIDDVSLTEISDEEAENRFYNGDFSSNAVGWSNIGMATEIPPEPTVIDCGFTNGDFETVFASNSAYAYNINDAVAEFTTANVHSGTHAIKYTSGYFTNYDTSVEPGTYKLSMWVNIVSGDTAEISGFVSGCGIGWQDFVMTAVRGVTDGWVKTSGEVTFTEAGTPQFGFKSYDGSGEVYIDDITLTKEYVEPLTTTTELLKNTDFSNGTTDWSVTGCEIIDDNGTKEIKMDIPADGNEYIQQTVTVEPGKTYNLSVDLMTQEQDGNDAQCQVYIIDSNWNMVKQEYKTYGWKHLTAEYTAPAGVTSVTILFQHNVVAGVSYWKNPSFTRTDIVTEEVLEENSLTNGDFETVIQDDGGNNVFFGYNLNGAAEISTANVHSGTYSAKYNSGYFSYYGTSVEPGTYKLSMWVNIVSGATVEMSGYVSGCGIPWQDFAMTSVRGVTDGWVQTSGVITFTEAGTPQFGFKSYDGFGEVYIDDITLEKIVEVPVYPESTYSEGIGPFGSNGNVCIKADTATDFWNFATEVTAGKKYVYTMDVKIENSEDGFQFNPYVMNFGDSWQNGTVYYGDTNWTRCEFIFTAAIPDATNGTRFGFTRIGTGTVYIDNISLRLASDIAAEGGLKDTNLATDTIIGIDADDEVSQTISGVEEGKDYILKFNVVSWEDDDANVYAMLGSSGIDELYIWQNDSYVGVTVTITAQESGDVDLIFGSLDAASVISDVELCRVYDFGDVNGDDNVNILDIVKFKKYFANDEELATYVYADVEPDGILDSQDLAGLVDIILQG